VKLKLNDTEDYETLCVITNRKQNIARKVTNFHFVQITRHDTGSVKFVPSEDTQQHTIMCDAEKSLHGLFHFPARNGYEACALTSC